MRLIGRDENGFAIGSYQARDATRIYRAAEQQARYRKKLQQERAKSKLIAALEPPGWVAGFEEASRDRRHRDRAKGRRAAEALGVAPPEWTATVEKPPSKRRKSRLY